MTSASVAPYLRLSEWMQIQPLFELLKLRGINVRFFRVSRKFRLQFARARRGLRVQFSQLRRAGIHALQFLQRAANRARLREQRIFILAQQIQRGLAQLQQLRRVAGTIEFFLDFFIFAGLKPRSLEIS